MPEDFLEQEHSRAMGAFEDGPFANEMDAETKAVIEPYVVNDLLRFDVQTTLTRGAPRKVPKPPLNSRFGARTPQRSFATPGMVIETTLVKSGGAPRALSWVTDAVEGP